MLFNEPKLLKFDDPSSLRHRLRSFSALQRAEIAEIPGAARDGRGTGGFSALQRAEIAEIALILDRAAKQRRFSALQRAEIAEIWRRTREGRRRSRVSVLFNEPKLLKSNQPTTNPAPHKRFQCSSTSRNC